MGDKQDSRRQGRPSAGQDRGVGLKRRRVEDEDHYGRQRESVLALAIRLCNKPQDGEEQVPPAEQLDKLQRIVIRELQSNTPQFIQILLDCAVELSHKTPAYAALIGLLNTEENDFVEDLLKATKSAFEEALKSGNCSKARLLLRLIAAMVPSNVLHASTVLTVLSGIVEDAIAIADEGGEGKDRERIWQPYTDFLVYISLMALPWGGSELADSAPTDLNGLLVEAEKYMELRPSSHTRALRPFLEGDDPASMSDSGAASFLGQMWEAVQEMRASGKWKVNSIPSHVGEHNEAVLATGQLHELGLLDIPKRPPCLKEGREDLQDIEAAAAVLAAFPPRGVIRLLPSEQTWGNLPKIERLVAEEYILDTIRFYDGDRVECARTLAHGLPLSGKIEPILTETIFSQMMRVPYPHLKPIAYATILADVCRLLPAVPRSMSACIREFFQRMHALDPQLRTQLAEWLAYHLSNFDFMWPWAKWAYVLQAPPHNPQRRFVVDTFSKLIRLSFYTNILSKVPENYKDIFPPKPEPQPLEDATPEDRNGNTEMADAEQANRLAGTPPGATAEEQQWAKEFITLVKEKKTHEEVMEWIAAKDLEEQLGGKVGVLRMVVRGLLVAGSKSFTHMLIALERYDSLLTSLLEDAGERGKIAIVATAADVWRDAPQRAVQAIDRLMAHRLVDGAAITRWAFGSRGLLHLENQTANGLAWEALYNAVNKTLARTQDAEEELQAVEKASVGHSAAEDEKADGTLPVMEESRATEVAGMALPDKRAQLAEAQKTQKDLFLLCFELFKEVLAANKPGPAAAGGEVEAQQEWYCFTLACLRAFTRRYHGPVAPLAHSLEAGIFSAETTAEDVRQAFIESLHI